MVLDHDRLVYFEACCGCYAVECTINVCDTFLPSLFQSSSTSIIPRRLLCASFFVPHQRRSLNRNRQASWPAEFAALPCDFYRVWALEIPEMRCGVSYWYEQPSLCAHQNGSFGWPKSLSSHKISVNRRTLTSVEALHLVGLPF